MSIDDKKEILDAIVRLDQKVDITVTDAIARLDQKVDTEIADAIASIDKKVDTTIVDAIARLDHKVDTKIANAITALDKKVDSTVTGAITALDQKLDVRMDQMDARIDEVIESIHVFSVEMDRQFVAVHQEIADVRSDLSTTKHTSVHHREMDLLVDKLETKNVLTSKDVREIRAVGAMS